MILMMGGGEGTDTAGGWLEEGRLGSVFACRFLTILLTSVVFRTSWLERAEFYCCGTHTDVISILFLRSS